MHFLIVSILVTVCLYFIAYFASKDKNPETLETPEKETPYYINEQIDAIISQLEAYHSIIDRLDESIKYSYDLEKIEKLKVKKADMLYKVARLEEKVQKLYDKWDL